MLTLSELFDEHNVEEVGLLKIDVERAELDVLLGIEDRHWPIIRNITAEVHDIDGRIEEVEALLRSKRYVLDDTTELHQGTSLHMMTASRTS